MLYSDDQCVLVNKTAMTKAGNVLPVILWDLPSEKVSCQEACMPTKRMLKYHDRTTVMTMIISGYRLSLIHI